MRNNEERKEFVRLEKKEKKTMIRSDRPEDHPEAFGFNLFEIPAMEERERKEKEKNERNNDRLDDRGADLRGRSGAGSRDDSQRAPEVHGCAE